MLAALPDEPFEQVEWKELKVGRNYHLTADYQHYSAPYRLAGRVLRVRLTTGRVTVFDGQQVVAEHRRKSGRKGQYSTDPGHVPPQHRNVDGLWSRSWFTDRAAAFGPATVAAVEQIWTGTRLRRKATWTARTSSAPWARRTSRSSRRHANSWPTCAGLRPTRRSNA